MIGGVPHSKSHRRVNKSSGKRHLATGYGEESGQLAQAQHDGDTGRRDDGITEQKTQRTTGSERPGGSQEETSTDDTSNASDRSAYRRKARGKNELTRSSGHDGSSIHAGARPRRLLDQRPPSRYGRWIFSRILQTSLVES